MLDRALFGQALVRLRGDRSQRIVAERAGVSTGTLCAWEKGHRTPHESQIPKIVRGLDCTEEELSVTIWRIQAERFKLTGSEAEVSTLHALSEHQEEIKALLRLNFKRISADLRPVMVRLQLNVRQTGEKLMAVSADLEALIVELGQEN